MYKDFGAQMYKAIIILNGTHTPGCTWSTFGRASLRPLPKEVGYPSRSAPSKLK
jgi:hypothetical protein